MTQKRRNNDGVTTEAHGDAINNMIASRPKRVFCRLDAPQSSRISAAIRLVASTVLVCALVVPMLCTATRSLVAQSSKTRGSLSGTVFVDTTSRTIANAEIVFPKLGRSARSDSTGNFRIGDLPPGSHDVVVRMVGYEPFNAIIAFGAAQQVEADFMLRPQIATLEKVNVSAGVDKRFAVRLHDFYERKRFGIGRFLTSDVFERADGQSMAAVIRRHIAGIGFTGKGTEQVPVTSRGKTCPVQVIMNGINAFNGRVGQLPFDINSINTNDVIGFEFYTVATTPLEFTGSGGYDAGAGCGTIVIWTK